MRPRLLLEMTRLPRRVRRRCCRLRLRLRRRRCETLPRRGREKRPLQRTVSRRRRRSVSPRRLRKPRRLRAKVRPRVTRHPRPPMLLLQPQRQLPCPPQTRRNHAPGRADQPCRKARRVHRALPLRPGLAFLPLVALPLNLSLLPLPLLRLLPPRAPLLRRLRPLRPAPRRNSTARGRRPLPIPSMHCTA